MDTGRMNAPSLSCRCAIAPFRRCYCWGRDREAIRAAPMGRPEKDILILGGDSKQLSFRGGAKRRTRNLEIPGSMLTHRPGMTENGSRPLSPQHVLLHLAAVEME